MSAPSSHGYSTCPSLHRDTRVALKDRSRREAHSTQLPANPVASLPISAGYTAEADRLDKDVVSDLSRWEAGRRQHKVDAATNLRATREARDAQRWANMEARREKEEREARLMAGTGRRNRSGAGYDIVTGSAGEGGEVRARQQQAVVEYRARLRSEALDRKGNTRYNILTGATRPAVHVPAAPPRPAPE